MEQKSQINDYQCKEIIGKFYFMTDIQFFCCACHQRCCHYSDAEFESCSSNRS